MADRTLLVVNKIDLAPQDSQPVLPDDMIAISVRTGAGLDLLQDRLAAIARERMAPDETPALTQDRHRRLLEAAMEDLSAFLQGSPHETELRAEDLRRASIAIGKITGRIDVEDVLDQIFSRFCIGK